MLVFDLTQALSMCTISLALPHHPHPHTTPTHINDAAIQGVLYEGEVSVQLT